MMIAPYRLELTATYERPDGKHELLEDIIGPVHYRENVDELAGEYLSEYETIHMSVDLTADERETYDEEYQIYRDYVDSHEFDLWKEEGYAEFLKRTSYDPQGRRALIAKQRAERIARDDVEIIWLQLGIHDDEAVARAEAAGLCVVHGV
jgi:superfamily II DNA or RNA helicase